MPPIPDKTRSTIEVGAVFGIVAFLISLAFNAGIQYSKMGDMQARQSASEHDIRQLQDTNASIGQTLVRIQVLMENMQATAELRKSGAMH